MVSHSSTEAPFPPSLLLYSLSWWCLMFRPGGTTKEEPCNQRCYSRRTRCCSSDNISKHAWIFILSIFQPLVPKTVWWKKHLMSVHVSGHDAAATLTGATGRSLWTLTNSAGGALTLTGGSSGGCAGGSGGGRGGGGGGHTSVTYSDRSVSSWG